jgi:hypothetical protein
LGFASALFGAAFAATVLGASDFVAGSAFFGAALGATTLEEASGFFSSFLFLPSELSDSRSNSNKFDVRDRAIKNVDGGLICDCVK